MGLFACSTPLHLLLFNHVYVHPTLVKAEFHKHFHPAETYVRHKNVCLLKISWLFIGNWMLNSACIFIYSTVSLNCKFMRFLHFLHKMFFHSKTYLFFCCFVFFKVIHTLMSGSWLPPSKLNIRHFAPTAYKHTNWTFLTNARDVAAGWKCLWNAAFSNIRPAYIP